MVLLHGGGPGAEKIAASWAEKNGVHQVVCKPNWDRDGKAAPFRRNDVLLNFLPKGLVAFPGSGITNNMIDILKNLSVAQNICVISISYRYTNFYVCCSITVSTPSQHHCCPVN